MGSFITVRVINATKNHLMQLCKNTHLMFSETDQARTCTGVSNPVSEHRCKLYDLLKFYLEFLGLTVAEKQKHSQANRGLLFTISSVHLFSLGPMFLRSKELMKMSPFPALYFVEIVIEIQENYLCLALLKRVYLF